MKHLAILFTLITLSEQVRAAETNPANTPAIPNFTAAVEYADSARLFQGVAGVERAANGRLWATWYGGGVTEDRHNYILLSTSNDDGKTWQRVMVLDPDGDGPVRAFDPCLWHDPEGKLWLFWGQETTQQKGRDFGTFVTFAITTTDSGKADAKWSAPRHIAKGVMMNKPTVTKDGRWLLPVSSWYTDGSSRVVVSTDHGTTFADLGTANLLDKKSRSADEHMIVERKDGSLWILVRGKFTTTDGSINGLGESVSTDGGKTWPDVKASAIPHLTTRFFIRRLVSGRLLLVRQNPPAGSKGRSHLTAFLSDDDGRTWKGGLLLDERDSACYPDAVQATDGTISVIYDYQRWGDKEILMAVFNEDEVLIGKLSSPKCQLRVLVNKATGIKPTYLKKNEEVKRLLELDKKPPAATPATPNFSPGPEYADGARMFQGVAGIERSANGRLWATWYGGGITEDLQNYILLDTSGDDGRSWQRVMVLDPDGDGPVRAFDPCLWHDPEGKLWLFWTQETTLQKGRDTSSFVTFAMTTTDSGKADARWSAPRPIARGVMMNKPTVAKDGRWLLPMATWAAEASARAVVSTDRGATFAELGAAHIPDRKSRNADEHMIVERQDGSLWMLVRGKFPPAQKDYTGIGESISTNGGRTWSDVTATTIPHSGTRFFIRKLAGGRLLLVRQNPPGGKKDRSHLTAFLSDDDGRTWKGGLLLDERLRVSYPDGAQAADGSIYLIYDHERGGPDSAKEILLAVFNEDDVLAGKITSPKSQLRVLVNKATGVKQKQPATAQTWPLDAVDARIKVSGNAKVASGTDGKSLALDGNSVIELKDSASLNAGAEGFTFSVWFNPYAPTNGQQVIAGKARYSSNERQWTLTVEPTGTLKAYIQQTGWVTISGKEPLLAGHWHLATLSVGADKAVLYLNGKRIGEAAIKVPVPATQASITLGGIVDARALKQTFSGAVDSAQFEPRVLSPEEIAASYQPVTATHEVPKPLVSDIPLWNERVPLPKAADLPVLDGVEFHVIKQKRPDTDGCNWTLGVGLAWHKDKLYASYGFNKGDENTATEEAQVRVSSDGGKSWGEPVVMDQGEGNLGVSHGVFLSHAGKLWAFQGAFYDKFQRTHTRAYLLDETTGQWQAKGVVLDGGFWPMQEPQKMDDGNWIMSGLNVGGNLAAVAISHGDDFEKWDKVIIPAAKLRNLWGESTVIVNGKQITNISRYGGKALALISTSNDFGRTWSTMLPSNLPMATSKPYAGTLSSGQRYLVCTTTADTGGKRSPLTIAVSKPGESVFSQVFVIRRSVFPEGPGVSSELADFSYPYAIEHDGRLYVGYTHKSHAANELAIIPISKLRIKP